MTDQCPTPASPEATVLATVHAALVAACDGPDAVPDGASTLDMVAALASLKTHYFKGWEACQKKRRAEPVVTDAMIDAALDEVLTAEEIYEGVTRDEMRAAITAVLKVQDQP